MVHEYALEPELVATWTDIPDCRYFRESFGIGRGRLVSRFPKNWRKRVYESIRARDDVTEMGFSRLQALLDQLGADMVKRSLGHFDHTRGGWLDNALHEHEERPFHAILAQTSQADHVLTGHELGDAPDTRWAVDRTPTVPREARAMAEAVAPLLRISATILFVDPHFNPGRRDFRRTLSEFLRAAITDRPVPPPTRVEVLVAHERKGTSDFFRQECVERLSPRIPEGIRVVLRRLAEKPGGEKLHNRYILTDLGGIGFGVGLDEGEDGQNDDLFLLGEEAYCLRWSQYCGAPPTAFHEPEEPIVVQGGAHT